MVDPIPNMIKTGGHSQVDVRDDTLMQKDMRGVYGMA